MQMFANFAISCGKHSRPQFSAVPSQINLHLIHILQNIIMEDYNFHQYHLSLFIVIKIMKQNNKSTAFDCSHLSDSTATCCVSPAHWLWGKSFLVLKICQTLFASVLKKAFISSYLIYRITEIEDLFPTF